MIFALGKKPTTLLYFGVAHVDSSPYMRITSYCSPPPILLASPLLRSEWVSAGVFVHFEFIQLRLGYFLM